MKKPLLILMLLACKLSASAQWTNTGFNYTTDRIAIGASGWSGKRLFVTGNDADHIAFLGNTNASGYGTVLSAYNDPLRVITPGSSNYLFVVNGNGNVGIGNNSPQALLDIAGYDASHVGADINVTRSSTSAGVGKGATLQLNDTGSNSFNIIQNSSVGLQFFNYNNYSTGGWAERMRIALDGKVGIGTTSPDALLSVKGTIHSQEVKVDLLGSMVPDYVFEKEYDLLTLDSIKTYVDKNKHLPEVPSAKEMEANGVNLGGMNMLLLKKVEELTLHMIEMDRKLTAVQKENQELKDTMK